LVEVVTKEGLGRLARRLVHFVLAVVLELHSRRESVRGLRTGVSATGNRGPHTDVKDEGAVVPGFPSPGVGSAGGGVGRRPEVAWAAEIGLIDKRVPPPPLAAEGRLTLNT
jgi:hypothetical protein